MIFIDFYDYWLWWFLNLKTILQISASALHFSDENLCKTRESVVCLKYRLNS